MRPMSFSINCICSLPDQLKRSRQLIADQIITYSCCKTLSPGCNERVEIDWSELALSLSAREKLHCIFFYESNHCASCQHINFLGSMEYFQRDLKISSELGSQVREEYGTLFKLMHFDKFLKKKIPKISEKLFWNSFFSKTCQDA